MCKRAIQSDFEFDRSQDELHWREFDKQTAPSTATRNELALAQTIGRLPGTWWVSTASGLETYEYHQVPPGLPGHCQALISVFATLAVWPSVVNFRPPAGIASPCKLGSLEKPSNTNGKRRQSTVLQVRHVLQSSVREELHHRAT